MTDSTDNARGPERIAHPYKGPDLPTEVFADPGRHDWYFREKMPDSYARFVRADLAPDPLADARVVALRNLLEEFARQNTTEELKKASLHNGDYEYSHDTFIRKSRAALAALSPTGGNADG